MTSSGGRAVQYGLVLLVVVVAHTSCRHAPSWQEQTLDTQEADRAPDKRDTNPRKFNFGKRADDDPPAYEPEEKRRQFSFGKRDDGPEKRRQFAFGKRVQEAEKRRQFSFGKREDDERDKRRQFSFGKRRKFSFGKRQYEGAPDDDGLVEKRRQFSFGKRAEEPETAEKRRQFSFGKRVDRKIFNLGKHPEEDNERVPRHRNNFSSDERHGQVAKRPFGNGSYQWDVKPARVSDDVRAEAERRKRAFGKDILRG